MKPTERTLTWIATFFCLVVLPMDCTAVTEPRKAATPPVYPQSELLWADTRASAPPDLRPILDRVAAQEGGDRWNGPYRLAELDEKLAPNLKSAEYRGWLLKAYKPEASDYYVISKIVGYSYRDQKGTFSTIDRFPVCICIVAGSGQYRRYVFNTAGTDGRAVK
jgi:hypothetical protein